VSVPLFAIIGGFGLDVGFEYAITPFASARLNVRYLVFGLFDEDTARFSALRLALEGRWYPQGNAPQGWFVSGSAQFDIFFDPFHRFLSFSVFAGGGYKAIFGSGQRGAFVVEPRLDFGLPLFSPFDSFEWSGYNILWGTGGPHLSVPIGVAF